MTRNAILLLIVALSFVLFGCITIAYHQKVDSGGNSVIALTMDMSALLAASSQYGTEPPDMGDVCENVSEGVECDYDVSGVVTLTASAKAEDGLYKFSKTSEFPNTVYTLELERLPQLAETDELAGGQAPSTSADFKSSQSKAAATMLAATGAEFTYTIEMPGEIYEAENGEIVDGKAEYDIIELMSEGENIVVRSRELDILMVGIAAVVVLVVIVLAAMFLFKGRGG